VQEGDGALTVVEVVNRSVFRKPSFAIFGGTIEGRFPTNID
jgi:hypothetical protein